MSTSSTGYQRQEEIAHWSCHFGSQGCHGCDTALSDAKIKGAWMDQSRAVDAPGKPLEFHLSPTRDAHAASDFFVKVLEASHIMAPRVITVGKTTAYPKAIKERKGSGDLVASCELRQSTSLHHLIEQDHGFIKQLIKPSMGFFSFTTAWRTFQGEEVMNMRRKGQVRQERSIAIECAFVEWSSSWIAVALRAMGPGSWKNGSKCHQVA